jgi:DNA ligase-1
MMLAKQGTISSVLQGGEPVAVEYKYDGARFQFHKMHGMCKMYSRRLEDVTSAMPDVVTLLADALPDDVIVDGEVIAVKGGRPLPFQTVLRRFRRKHNISEAADAVTLIPNLFDILYYREEMLINLPFRKRREILLHVASGYVTPQLISKSEVEIEAYYHTALDAGHEGVMLKLLDSRYTPGIRGKDWSRSNQRLIRWIFVSPGLNGEKVNGPCFWIFSPLSQSNGKLVPISRVATGFTDEQLNRLYHTLKDDIIRTDGKMVYFEPRLVFEIGYSEIQKSPNYEGGYALRFPRFIEVREDKSPDDANTAEDVEERYLQTSSSVQT